jgi:hypothetical protein
VLRDFGEEIGIAPRHWDVVQRAYAPRRVDAHGHQKTAPGTGDFLERHVHSSLVIAIIFRPKQSLCRIRADHKRSPRKQARLFDEGGRSREFGMADCAAAESNPALSSGESYKPDSREQTGAVRSPNWFAHDSALEQRRFELSVPP